jgi:hypothetical protein
VFALTADCSRAGAVAAAPAPFCARPGATSPSGAASDATAVAVVDLPRAARRRRAPTSPAEASGPRRAPRRAAAAASPTFDPASYDFATIYAFVGSLFDPACAGVDVGAALAQMAPGDADVARVYVRSLAAHLRSPEAMTQVAVALAEGAVEDEAAGRG